ncbi:MAG: hypothetical protein CMB80_22830 [Flammeovirgaceae bacterium]|nr:hypothetical protein [Flammeovirgaceae bacterium]MBE62109.1 hypothetical protein [Flammeovirgaceae bacterium]HCX24314.1 hypothetical protein [Cytophagales bacterium]|tara:strand:+ start:6887 stop:8371 length:1485 start_codon:yes stop_codon:yes gene_type:complete
MRSYQTLRTIGLLGLLLLITSCLEEPIEPDQFGSVTGVVLNINNNKPLEGAEINTNPSSSVVYTDSLGEFTIGELAIGEYSFTAVIDGYNKTFVNATISAGTTTEVTIKMEPEFFIPESAGDPIPTTGANKQSRNLSLSWSSSAVENDSVTYDVLVYESNIDTAIFKFHNLNDTTCSLENLRFETTYFWQVVSKASSGGQTNSPLWNFTTLDFPDNRFLYVRNLNNSYQIFSSNDSLTQKIQLTRNSFNSFSPKYNSIRKEIAFCSTKDLNTHIYLMDYKGGNSRQITTLPVAGYYSEGSEFCWWPNNGGVVYSHYDKLLSIDRNGSNLKTLALAPESRNFGDCDYNGVVNKIVVQTTGTLPYQNELYLMNPNGTDTVRIVDDLPGIIENPAFSIDGTQIVYTRDVSGFESADGRQLDSRIFILDLSSMTVTDISTSKQKGTNDLRPRFSPFGSKIIFANVLNDGSGTVSTYTMDIDGNNRNLLFENADMPNWK